MGEGLLVRVDRRVKQWWRKRAFDRVAKRVFDTEPVVVRGDSPVFVSLVCHRDVAPYLLALKSLYIGVGQGRVAIINDGSLTPADLKILSHHIPGLEVFDIQSIDTGKCPRGGCWERLVKVLELSRDNYVIQADADTLVSGDVSDVVRCWQENRSFILGTAAGQGVSNADRVAKMVQGWIAERGPEWAGVCGRIESALDKLPDASERLYVHASAGFGGYGKGAFSMTDLEEFSVCMSEIIGRETWHKWGSEQVASNYVLANSAGAVVLPFPRYACFEPQLRHGEHALLHFIGTYRYDNGAYRRRAREFLLRYTEVGT